MANIQEYLFTLPQSVAIVIKRHKLWHEWEFFMKEGRQKPIDVRVRVSNELHEELKAHAKKEERSMNYLINKAVEQFLKQHESAKA